MNLYWLYKVRVVFTGWERGGEVRGRRSRGRVGYVIFFWIMIVFVLVVNIECFSCV